MSVALRFWKIVYNSDFEYSGLLAQRVKINEVPPNMVLVENNSYRKDCAKRIYS